MDMVAEFTDQNFEDEVLKADMPVLVDFWSPSCGPCRQIAPLLDQLAVENSGSVKIGKIDISTNMGVAGRYAIQFIPALMVFKNGEVVGKLVGLQPKARLQEALDAAKA